MRGLGRERSSHWGGDLILFHNNYLVNQLKAPEDKGRELGFSHPFCHLLEPQEEDLKPYPGKQQQDDHDREGKAEPGGKVHHIDIFWEEPEGECGLRCDIARHPPCPFPPQ